jgi:nucleolar protein 6
VSYLSLSFAQKLIICSAGGGGTGDVRKEKLKSKNEKLNEERKRKMKKKQEGKDGEGEEKVEEKKEDPNAGMHPSRMARLNVFQRP